MQLEGVRERVRQAGIVQVGTWQRGYWTVVVLKATLDGHDYEGVGFSKYNAHDAACPDTPYDAAKGDMIARGKAELDIAQQVVVAEDPVALLIRMTNALLESFKQLGDSLAGPARLEKTIVDNEATDKVVVNEVVNDEPR